MDSDFKLRERALQEDIDFNKFLKLGIANEQSTKRAAQLRNGKRSILEIHSFVFGNRRNLEERCTSALLNKMNIQLRVLQANCGG